MTHNNNELEKILVRPEVILEKAIQKAIENGWDYEKDVTFFRNSMFNKVSRVEGLAKGLNPEIWMFRQDFAKALWGNEIKELWFDDCDTQDGQPLLGGEVSYPYNEGAAIGFKTSAWQYHLQQMVIAPDPLKYLEENLPK